VTAVIDIDPETLSNQERYKLLIGSVLPRPIAFVSTLSPEGKPNLAPFSFFTGVCSSPLVICFAPMRRGSDGEKKDTLRNIEATGEFVVHVVTESIAEKMNRTSAEYPYGVSEFEMSGLTPIPSDKVKPYRVKESPIQMECVLHQLVNLGDTVGAGSLVLGRVVQLHYSTDVYQDGKIILEKLKPVARLAGNAYARVTDTFAMERPVIEKDPVLK
jgi:flavin reductase (DIM6/NTAB) family NADH-FMN oxidoreductase RutF